MQCSECKYWERFSSVSGKCKKDPPKVLIIYNGLDDIGPNGISFRKSK